MTLQVEPFSFHRRSIWRAKKRWNRGPVTCDLCGERVASNNLRIHCLHRHPELGQRGRSLLVDRCLRASGR